jgi:hypothetical protein
MAWFLVKHCLESFVAQRLTVVIFCQLFSGKSS